MLFSLKDDDREVVFILNSTDDEIYWLAKKENSKQIISK